MKWVPVLVLAVMGLTTQAYAMDQEQAESLCKRFAVEDEITQEEMKGYMDICISDALKGDYDDLLVKSEEDQKSRD